MDVLVTDPPFGSEHVALYTDLARLGARVLRPGSCAYVMTGQHNLPDFLNALAWHLSYSD